MPKKATVRNIVKLTGWFDSADLESPDGVFMIVGRQDRTGLAGGQWAPVSNGEEHDMEVSI